MPLGYANAFEDLTNLEETHGGFPWGVGALAVADGSRKPSRLELTIHETQGKIFLQTFGKF